MPAQMLTHRLGQFYPAQSPKCLYRLTNLLEFLSVNFPTTLDYHGALLFKRSILLGCVLKHAHTTLPKGHLIVYSNFATKKFHLQVRFPDIIQFKNSCVSAAKGISEIPDSD
jgi:hypothetical protein